MLSMAAPCKKATSLTQVPNQGLLPAMWHVGDSVTSAAESIIWQCPFISQSILETRMRPRLRLYPWIHHLESIRLHC